MLLIFRFQVDAIEHTQYCMVVQHVEPTSGQRAEAVHPECS